MSTHTDLKKDLIVAAIGDSSIASRGELILSLCWIGEFVHELSILSGSTDE